MWQPANRYAAKDPIVWRLDEWELLAKRSVQLADRIENAHGVVTARYGNAAAFGNRRTGLVLGHVNGHFNAGVEGPPGHPEDIPRQREHHDHLVGTVRLADDLTSEWQCPVLVTADFNVDFGADKRVQHPEFPYAILTAAGFVCCWELGEQSTRTGRPHKGRTIDQSWLRGGRFVDVRSPNRWVAGDPVESDHLPVLFGAEIP